MPELPEVEVVVRGLRKKVVGGVITTAEVRHPKIVGGEDSVADFRKQLKGAQVVGVERAGKLIFIHLDTNHTLVIHLKLTGQLIYTDKNGSGYKGGHSQKVYDVAPPHKHTHVILEFTDGSRLYFNDLRRFGWMKIVPSDELPEVAPDPTRENFSRKDFLTRVMKHYKSNIYKVLLDQNVIAGLGNIYVNELLWRNKIHPLAPVAKLDGKQILTLAAGIKPLLNDAIKYGGSSANTFVKIDGSKGTFTDYLDVYHREGEGCHRHDGGIIKRVKIGGRSAFYCPVCQVAGK